jgi:tripartite-type tricarboxylate transporter receptor subunit TctC
MKGNGDRPHFWALLFAAAALLSVNASAQSSRPIRLIVPFAAGGSTDLVSRLVATPLAERLGQPIVVENRPGGGGVVGADVAAKAAADGHTLVMGSLETYGITPTAAKRLPYNAEKDLAPIVLVAFVPSVLAVHPSLKLSSMKEFIDYARANPGRIRYGTVGLATNTHLTGELLKQRLKIDIVNVPYKGGGPALIDAVSGQVEALIAGAATVAPRVKTGELRGLALTSSKRLPLLPDVPTMDEQGIRDVVSGAVLGLFATAGSPAPLLERIARETTAVLRLPEIRSRWRDLGVEEIEPISGAAFGEYMRKEASRWREIATAANVKEE